MSLFFSKPQTLQSLYKKLEQGQGYGSSQRQERSYDHDGFVEKKRVVPLDISRTVKVSFLLWVPITVGTQGRSLEDALESFQQYSFEETLEPDINWQDDDSDYHNELYRSVSEIIENEKNTLLS